jgi:hypothetical protein
MTISLKVLAVAAGVGFAVSAATGVAVAGSWAMINGTAAVLSGRTGTVVCLDKAGDHLLDGASPRTHVMPIGYGGHTTNAIVVSCP